MPRIVRPMYADDEGLPRVGTTAKCLGVRPPPNSHADVELDEAGNVTLNRKGLSVSQDWRQLPGHLIPEHLDDGFNGASGKGMRIFVRGEGSFDEALVAETLELLHKPNTRSSGVVAPVFLIPLAQYQQDLAKTRKEWVVNES